MLETAYLMLTGAGIAGDVAPPLILGLAARFPSVLVLPTPNASRVLNLRDISRLGQQIADSRPPAQRGQPPVQIVESYFDPAILPRPPHGLVVVAPCTFNSLNHLSAGLSPNLALAVTNEAIGRRTPVIVAVACNEPLWAHPAAPASAARLREWGCTVLTPVPADGPTGTRLMLSCWSPTLSTPAPRLLHIASSFTYPLSVTLVTDVSQTMFNAAGIRMRMSLVAVIVGVELSVTVSVLAVAAACPTEKVWFAAEEREAGVGAPPARGLIETPMTAHG